MSRFKSISNDIKGMFSSPQTPASQKPSTNSRYVWIAILAIFSTLLFGILFGILYGSGSGKKSSLGSNEQESLQAPVDQIESGPLVIQFSSHRSGAVAQRGIQASTGTLARVRLLNSVETYETVPAFAQVTDYALGKSFYGWTLIGDASSDTSTERVKISFKTLKDPGTQRIYELSGKALSLDGTLGVQAEKIQNIVTRSFVGGAKAGASSMGNSIASSNDLSGFLLKALIQGLQTELSSDLGAAYNRTSAFRLKPGAEFFIQLTEGF